MKSDLSKCLHALNRLSLLAISATVLALAATPFNSVHALEILSPRSLVNGTPTPELVREYMAWALSDLVLEVPQSPRLFNAPNGTVAFAPITSIQGTHTLNFDLALGTPLVLSSLYWSAFLDNDQNSDPPPCNIAVDRFACTQEDLRNFINESTPALMTLRIDSISFAVGDDRRFDSGGQPLNINFAQETGFGVAAGQWNALYDGWFAVLGGFSPGLHVVEYGFNIDGYEIQHVANISVVPVPASAGLVCIGLIALWRRHGHGKNQSPLFVGLRQNKP
jgi:hypothetical protein